MKFKILQGELSQALLAANKSLMVKANLPILANVLISVVKGRLEVLSTNLETATRVTIKCQSETDGKITIPGRSLFEFVSQLPEGEIVFEKLGEEAVISTKRYSARFATQSTEDFPAIPKIEKGYTVLVPRDDFVNAASRVVFCAAADEGRPVLTGVLCETGKNTLSMVATDGYRLGFQKVNIDLKEDAAFKVVVPAKSVVEVIKVISEQRDRLGEKNIEFVVAESLNQINFKIGDVEYTSRLIEGSFPNWQKLIPTSFSSSAKVNKEEFIKIVRVASIFARESGNIVRFKLEPSRAGHGLLSVYAANNQIGSNEAQTEIELSGKGGEIAFNFRYILEMLSSVNTEEVEFEMIESLNPGRLTIPGDKNYFHIIMPVRLQS